MMSHITNLVGKGTQNTPDIYITSKSISIILYKSQHQVIPPVQKQESQVLNPCLPTILILGESNFIFLHIFRGWFKPRPTE